MGTRTPRVCVSGVSFCLVYPGLNTGRNQHPGNASGYFTEKVPIKETGHMCWKSRERNWGSETVPIPAPTRRTRRMKRTTLKHILCRFSEIPSRSELTNTPGINLCHFSHPTSSYVNSEYIMCTHSLI
uniref:Uncharacterized protein n=1 Tax=Molossus molossus TaxID=27622 RepID=A0A7J8E2P5_MOLMO|nr:hypothetical protein HJG59_009083 [Molossus molossus]